MQGSGEQWWSHHSTKTLHHLLWYDEGTPLSRTCLFSLICFSSHLHVTGFSSCRITTMIHSYLVWFLWWLRHGAIGPIEATLFRVNVDWTDFRIYTFELVIRLSNAKQLALRFSAVLRFPRTNSISSHALSKARKRLKAMDVFMCVCVRMHRSATFDSWTMCALAPGSSSWS